MPPGKTALKDPFSHCVKAGLSSSAVRKVFEKVTDAVYSLQPRSLLAGASVRRAEPWSCR